MPVTIQRSLGRRRIHFTCVINSWPLMIYTTDDQKRINYSTNRAVGARPWSPLVLPRAQPVAPESGAIMATAALRPCPDPALCSLSAPAAPSPPSHHRYLASRASPRLHPPGTSGITVIDAEGVSCHPAPPERPPGRYRLSDTWPNNLLLR